MTPLDTRQRAIAEQEAKLRAEMERCRKVIEDGPRLAEERQRRNQEEFVRRKSRTEARPASRAALPDHRYELTSAAPLPRRRLRSERQQGRFMFFVLLIIFTAVVCTLYYAVTHS